MIEKRPFDDLALRDHDWLKARHHFSFGNYHDPAKMGWGPIRVWNDDEIAPQTGFAMHPHRNMEIITYVREGAISHADNQGGTGRTGAGDVQVMSAGTGIFHSENNDEDVAAKLFQIWIEPREAGGEPRWDAKKFPSGDRTDKLEVLASGFEDDIAGGALMIRADARLYGATLSKGSSVAHDIAEDARIYLVASKGSLRVNGELLNERDALAIKDENRLDIEAVDDAELVFVETLDHQN